MSRSTLEVSSGRLTRPPESTVSLSTAKMSPTVPTTNSTLNLLNGSTTALPSTTGMTTTILPSAPSTTFSTTLIALMVVMPIAVLVLIIVFVCICLRRADRSLPSDTYEDFSKVDQSGMMRMSMYNALDEERGARNLQNGTLESSKLIESENSHSGDGVHNGGYKTLDKDGVKETDMLTRHSEGKQSEATKDVDNKGIVPSDTPNVQLAVCDIHEEQTNLSSKGPAVSDATETDSHPTKDQESAIKQMFKIKNDGSNHIGDYYQLEANFASNSKSDEVVLKDNTDKESKPESAFSVEQYDTKTIDEADILKQKSESSDQPNEKQNHDASEPMFTIANDDADAVGDYYTLKANFLPPPD